MVDRPRLLLRLTLPLLLIATGVMAIVALLAGPVDVLPVELWRAVIGELDWEASLSCRVVILVRLPRIVLAGLVGAALSLAGLSAQTLFHNPLASPSVLGVSSGAAAGAIAGLLIFGSLMGYAAVPIGGLVGGVAVCLVILWMARGDCGFAHSLLLAGVAIGAFCAAINAGTLYLAGERLQTVVFWLMGGLWGATWREVALMLPITALAYACLLVAAPAMNLLLSGDEPAGNLGVQVVRLQVCLTSIIAGATAVAVSLTGVIGFVGLMVPHLLRLLVGADHRRLAPACAVGGALLLISADLLARTLRAPEEIPVGIFTSAIGAPVFLLILRRSLRKGGTL